MSIADLTLRAFARLALTAFVAGVAWMLLLTYDQAPASAQRPAPADHRPPSAADVLTPVPSTTPLTR